MSDPRQSIRAGQIELYMARVVARMRARAAMGEFHGQMTAPAQWYLGRCRFQCERTESIIIFTRDTGHHTSGWFKNPDYERCLHLSISAFGERARSFRRVWPRSFFGDDLRLAWLEPAATKAGRDVGVEHWRVFCDAAWCPILPRGEVYSREFTELGWKSASELGSIIESPLVPG